MKTFFNIFFLVIINAFCFGQTIGINSTGATADNSAMLDIVASDKGLLIPRVSIADLSTAAPITAPVTSLLVYNTNTTSGVGYYFWDGTKWVKLSDNNTNSDEDWHEVGGILAPDNINDDIFTQGKVGVGVIMPQAQLDIVSANGVIGISVDKTSGNSGLAQLYLDENRNAQNAHGKHIQFANGASPNVEIGTLNSSSGLDYFFIDVDQTDVGSTAHTGASFVIRNNGNVGVGTDTPSRKFHISGAGIGVQKFKIEEASAGGESMTLGNGTAASTLAFSNTGDFWIGGVANVDNNMVATEADIFIQGSNGYIGLGTATPQAKVNIPNVGTITTGDWTQAALLIGDATTGLAMDFNEIYTKSPTGLIIGSESNAPLTLVSNSTASVVIAANGNVGIVNAVPAYQLQLSTNSAAKPTSASWTVASDRRLKKDIKKYDGGLNDIMKIEPVWYTYTGKAGMPKDTGVGIIAQDLQKIAPYMVGEWTYENEERTIKENYLGVDNGAMTYMLINAVKELKKENDLLKERLERLEKN